MKRWSAAVLAIVILTAGCGKSSNSASSEKRQVDVLRALPFGDPALKVVTDVLVQAGVGLHEDNTEVTPAQPVRVTRWQAQNLAVEAANSGGISGEALNALVPVPHGVVPVQYLIAAWVKSYDSASAKFARELMGEQDWKSADRVLFPNLVLTLFLADALAGAKVPAGQKAQSMALAGFEAVGVCTFAATFIQNAIADVAKALKVDTSGGGFLGFLGKIWNVAVDLAATALQGLITTVTKPVVDIVVDAFGVVALISQVSSFLVKWRAELKAEPSHNRFGVDSEAVTGKFQLTVVQKQLPVPDFVIECASAFGVDLKNAGSAAGSKVTWRETNTGRADLSTRQGADEVLAQDKSARYRYQTGQETSELAKSSETESPALIVSASVQRNDVQKIRELFTKLLFDQLPGSIRGIVEGLAKPFLAQADSKLAALTDVSARAATFITYHLPEKKTPGSAGNGKKAVMPTICPSVVAITKASPRPPIGAGGWEFDGEILPEKAMHGIKTCGYSAWLGPKDQFGFQQVEQIGLFLSPDAEPMPANARPVSIPGTDRAWFGDMFLKVVVGDKLLGVEVRIREPEDPEETAIEVAKVVLGVD